MQHRDESNLGSAGAANLLKQETEVPVESLEVELHMQVPGVDVLFHGFLEQGVLQNLLQDGVGVVHRQEGVALALEPGNFHSVVEGLELLVYAGEPL